MLRSPALTPLLMLLVLTLAGPAHAQASKEEIAKAIHDLSSPKFSVREKASALLWSAGRQGELALLRALPRIDLEGARRAEKILEKFRWGLFPDTPKEILPLLTKYRAGDPSARTAILEDLLRRGPTHYRLIARLLSAVDTRHDSWRLGRAILHAEFEEALRALLRKHDFTGLEDLLVMRVALGDEKAGRDYAVFLHLTGRMAPALEDYTASAALFGRKREATVLAHLHRVSGDLPAARRAAEKAGDRELVQAILVEQGDWKALSALGEKLVGEDALPEFRAFFHRRAGNRPAFERAIAEVVKAARARGANDGLLWWDAKSLFLNDRPEEALAILALVQADDRILDLLVRQRRFADAFRLLDGYRDKGAEEKFWASIRRARLLNHLGERAAARKLLEATWRDNEARFLPSLHAGLLRAEREMSRGEEALRRCARLLDRWPPPLAKQPAQESYLPGRYADLLLRELFKVPEGTANVWWQFLRDRHARPPFLGCRLPEETLTTLRRLRALYDGKLPKAEFAALVRAARKAALARPEGRLRLERAALAQQAPAAPDEWLQALADTCRVLGHDDLLRECLETSVEAGESAVSFFELAKFLVGKKQWSEAAAVCARGRAVHPAEPDLALLHAHALKQLGRGAEAARLEEAGRLLPLADEVARHLRAETLVTLGRHDEARREFALVTRSGPRMAWSTRNAWHELSTYAARDGDDLRAAACWERWYLGVLGRGSFFLEADASIWVPYRLHFLRARGLLAANDVAGALAEIATCERFLPGETETATTFVPALAKCGRPRDADALFDRAFAFHAALCKDHPRYGWAHNALAWLAARCRRRLDVALKHGREAVRLAPDNAAFLDTLAEVHFQRGERAEAIDLMRRCMALAPGRAYYRTQLQRFEGGQR